jgi:hypothetical protein
MCPKESPTTQDTGPASRELEPWEHPMPNQMQQRLGQFGLECSEADGPRT